MITHMACGGRGFGCGNATSDDHRSALGPGEVFRRQGQTAPLACHSAAAALALPFLVAGPWRQCYTLVLFRIRERARRRCLRVAREGILLYYYPPITTHNTDAAPGFTMAELQAAGQAQGSAVRHAAGLSVAQLEAKVKVLMQLP